MEVWTLKFPASTYTGDSAAQVLRRLSKDQWTPEDRARIKRALAWRAWVVTRSPLDEDADDAEFLMSFARTGLARLEVKTDAGTVVFE